VHRIAFETSEFRADFRRASRQTQTKIEAFIRIFDQDAARGGMRLKSPEDVADSRVKVARVDKGLRAVLVDLGDGDYALARVMEHDAAYRWAGSLRPDVSSFNGLPRLLDLSPLEQASAAASLLENESVDLFAHRRDRDFESLGVPRFMIGSLRGVRDPHEASDLADYLGRSDPLLGLAILGLLDEAQSVDQIYSDLVALEGTADPDAPRTDGVWNAVLEPEEVKPEFDTGDLGAALERPGAQQRFRLVEDSAELVAALQGDFADWQIFLHPLQSKAAYTESFSGPARVSGGAGTGKTVVLLHRAKALLDRAAGDAPPRILVTTFTTHLQQDLTRLLRQLVGVDRANEVEIRTVDSLAHELHRSMTGVQVEELAEAQEHEIWQTLAAKSVTARSAAFLRNEYRHVLLARGVRTLEEYLNVARSGRGVRLGQSERNALWPIFESFEAQTRRAGRFSTLQLTESVAALLERLPTGMYDHVLVDEAQDLHASQWRLLRAIVADGADDLFIAGDAFQRIYGDTVSLRSIGIETRGRSIRLRRNYRTTHEIVDWALGLVGDETVVDLDELGADLTGYHSVRHGPAPRFLAFSDREEEMRGLISTVQGWLELGYKPEAMAVAARNKPELAEIATALQRADIPACQLGRRGRIDTGVNVATMHRLKGLEYPCVAITGLSAGRVPPPGAVCPVDDDRSQHLADLQTERSLVYVAATRARDELTITWSGEPTPLVGELWAADRDVAMPTQSRSA
jgi:superfamily I DNA/RNA helicase